jgi:hypothetical protein
MPVKKKRTAAEVVDIDDENKVSGGKRQKSSATNAGIKDFQ